ncbi:MFS transporter [Actinoallomurus sp. CA-150999]|uniref:MFS transporter n=1 Tax=Actinoallomurus sp. CA-150999 TaxID=3239887 RepID=UPI003D90C8B8
MLAVDHTPLLGVPQLTCEDTASVLAHERRRISTNAEPRPRAPSRPINRGLVTATPATTQSPPSGVRRLWDRELPHYPDTAARWTYLAITVVITVALYYQLYVQGSVATRIIAEYGFSFTEFVFVTVIGFAVGAFAALAAGLADRWGRVNLVVIGLLLTGLLTTFAVPNAPNKTAYTALMALVFLVEGVILIVTPALIRDFSPQMGRAAAMGLWTLGSVVGYLVVTSVSSNTVDSHPDWRFQFHLAGGLGLAAFVLAALGLRELAPRLRDQLMVSTRDRALIEARALGLDEEQALKGHWRQVLKADVVISALAISTFLIFFLVVVGFLVVYMATVFGYSEARANSLGNWFAGSTAVVLVATGLLSDRLLVRKPFMIVGAALSVSGTIGFTLAATEPSTGYRTFVVCFVLAGTGLGMAYVAWMASFTETVERHNPAATATGLAIWGWIQRLIATVAVAALTLVVPATSVLADKGSRLAKIVKTYPDQVAVLRKVDASTLAVLRNNPNDPNARTSALSALSGAPAADVRKAITLSTKYADQIATSKAIEPATLQALGTHPTDTGTRTQAIQQITSALGISTDAAVHRLDALAAVPSADLAFLRATGPSMEQAATRLQSVSKVPAEDLAYLSANGAKVSQAQKDNPRQWQRWWWLCAIGQFLFIPAIFLMTGRWSPRKARQDAEAHERMVTAELDALASESNAPQST